MISLWSPAGLRKDRPSSMHIYKTPGFVRSLLPGLTWKITSSQKVVYLTFDDGPVPGITDWVLDVLNQYRAKATFFVIGDNVEKYPNLFTGIVEKGHAVGNHTQNHLSAWQNSKEVFLNNIERCSEVMDGYIRKPLFRPPYGKLTPSIINKLKSNYDIIMWDVLTGDYNASITVDECLKKSLKYTSDGSIVVFHDSYKAEKTLKSVLPEYLKELNSQGFTFKSL